MKTVLPCTNLKFFASYYSYMSDFSFINTLYQSKTITPSYNIPQIFYTIMLIGRKTTGIGRYKIKSHIGLGEGATKTLLTRLREAEIIHLESQQKGHVLTLQGNKIYRQLLQIMTFPQPLQNEENEYVIGENAYYTRVKKQYCPLNYPFGINQRDEAIKIGGTGASCLYFDGQHLIFPRTHDKSRLVPPLNLDEGDIIIIGGGNSKNSALLATIAAAYSVFKERF